MPELPQSVRIRLKTHPGAAEHLDADVLSAFAERRLDESERQIALAHLAGCAECRQVLALAAEAEAEISLPAATKARPHRRLTAWRLTLIGALAAVAISATVLLRVETSRPHQGEVQIAAQQNDAVRSSAQPNSRPSAPSMQTEAAAAPAQNPSNAAKVASAPRPQPGQPPPLGALTVQTQSVVADQAAPAGSNLPPAAPPPHPRVADQMQTMNTVVARTPVPAPSNAAAQPAPQPTQQSAQGGAQAMEAREAVQQPGAIGGMASQQQETAKSAPASADLQPSNRTSQGLGENRTARALTFNAVQTQWRITPTGRLERRANPNQQPAQWQPVQVEDGVIFRVAVAWHNDVWAGGNGGALFHSSDGGEHWTRVAPSSGDRTLSADVVSIDVAQDGGTVQLRTANGETWTSDDVGKSWRIVH